MVKVYSEIGRTSTSSVQSDWFGGFARLALLVGNGGVQLFAFGFAQLRLHDTRQLFDMPFGVGGSTQPQGNMNMDQMEAATQEYVVQPARTAHARRLTAVCVPFPQARYDHRRFQPHGRVCLICCD